MAPNLVPGTFKIVSLIDNESPASVNFSKIGAQPVFLNGPVTTWMIKQEGYNTYRLSVGPYAYTGIVGDRVTASIHSKHSVEWIATYREVQDAYTIQPVNNRRKAWTVPNDEPNAKIEIRMLVEHPSLPPKYLTSQLFRFEEVDADE